MKIVISAGHGKYVSGAIGYLNEFDEACRVVAKLTEILGASDQLGIIGVTAYPFVDNVSKTQDENLKRIVDYHNSKERDLDVSIHFNCNETTSKPMGTECLYVSQEQLASDVSTAISNGSNLINRGPKKRTDLYFLNKTEEPAILIEVCFVDSEADAGLYLKHFDSICHDIARAITGVNTSYLKLLVIPPVTIWRSFDSRYIRFTSDLDICNDGSGPAFGDPYHQSQTAYYNGGKYLNAQNDKYIVIPPQVRSMVAPVVMGCQARLTNIHTAVSTEAVTGEIGPKDKTGEAAYCAAKVVNPAITHNSGDKNIRYLYELWPGKPAVVDGKTYKLEPAG